MPPVSGAGVRRAAGVAAGEAAAGANAADAAGAADAADAPSASDAPQAHVAVLRGEKASQRPQTSPSARLSIGRGAPSLLALSVLWEQQKR